MSITGFEKSLDQYTKTQLIEIAKKYTIYYKTPSGKGSTSNYQSLSKEFLIQLIEDDKDYQREKPKSRIELLKMRVANIVNQDVIMKEIKNLFEDTVLYPEVGKFYTFTYHAKTPDIEYDVYPLIACTHLNSWGFKGINFHWRKSKTYTWEEIESKLHVVYYEELDDMLSIPYSKFLLNK